MRFLLVDVLNSILAVQSYSLLLMKKEAFVFKIDLEKAYGHMEWNFLDFVLEKKGFKTKCRRWISVCLHLVHLSILISARPNGKFGASRGISKQICYLLFYWC